MRKINVAVLGATGTVGQRFIQLLEHHPYFKIKALLASTTSAGKQYGEVVNWLVSGQIPEEVKNIIVQDATPNSLKGRKIEIVFSALPTDIAKVAEPQFAAAGYQVFSNASAWRNETDVPLVVTEINADHLKLVKVQQKRRGWPGFIVTNPNCSTIIMVLALKPLVDAFGVKQVIVSTMQAISGAGYPGVASLDIVDNVLPYIGGEEEKVENEPLKILGSLIKSQTSDDKVRANDSKQELEIKDVKIKISASCQRVCTLEGHLEDLHISLGRRASVNEIKKVLTDFGSAFRGLPMAPAQTLVVTENPLRPQTRLDRDTGRGMAVTIGRIRPDRVLTNGIKMTILGHNTIRGAAGQSIMNAEWWTEEMKK